MEKNRIYVAIKPCKKPHLILDNNIDMTKLQGIEYHEDEIGYYEIYGELKIDAS